MTPDFIALLRRHRIGLVVADTVAWPLLMDVTSDFVYCRLHGSVELHASGYDDAALDRWADHISAWARGYENRRGKRASARPPAKRASRDVYIYFDNDKKSARPVRRALLDREGEAAAREVNLYAADWQ